MALTDTATHSIDARGGIRCCACGKVIEHVGFITPAKSAPVVLYRRCKGCSVFNTIFLDRLVVLD